MPQGGPKRTVKSHTNTPPISCTHGTTLPAALSGPAVRLCSLLGVERHLPAADDMVAVAAGVLEGENVEGVRYPPFEEMTGWYLMPAAERTPDDFMLMHAIHLFETRSDIARFLALPPGWSFDTSGPGHVRFDPSVVQDHEAI